MMGNTDLNNESANQAADDDELRRRLKKHGSRGLVKVASTEGASVTKAAAQNLVPAG